MTEREIDINGWLIARMEKMGMAWDVIRIAEKRILDARASQAGEFRHA